jgi:hypothetical protein
VGAACNAIDACSDAKELFCDEATLKCAVQKYAAPGEACDAAATIVCLAGGDCLGMSGATTGTCFAPAKEGEACNRNKSCLEPAGCAGTTCRLPPSARCN